MAEEEKDPNSPVQISFLDTDTPEQVRAEAAKVAGSLAETHSVEVLKHLREELSTLLDDLNDSEKSRRTPILQESGHTPES